MAAQLNNFLMGFSISEIFHLSLNQCSLRLNKQYHQFYCNKSKLINEINAMTIEIMNVISASICFCMERPRHGWKKEAFFILKCFKLCKLERVSITSRVWSNSRRGEKVCKSRRAKKKGDQNTHVYDMRGLFLKVAFHLFSCICR